MGPGFDGQLRFLTRAQEDRLEFRATGGSHAGVVTAVNAHRAVVQQQVIP
jgi:hypothetical protein